MSIEDKSATGSKATESQGATEENLSAGQGTGGAPVVPEPSNKPPVDEKKANEEQKKSEEQKKETEEKAEKKVEENKETEQKQESEISNEYVEYNDDVANSVVSIFKEAKMSAKEAHLILEKAVSTGDFNKLDMDLLTQKLGKEKAILVKTGVIDYYTRMNESSTKSANAIYGEVGGEQNWQKVQTWAQKKSVADKGFAAKVESFNKMFSLDAISAGIAARELKTLYEADADNSSLEIKKVEGDGAATDSNSNVEYLSRSDYLTKMKEAQAKGDTREVERLRTQRQASRKSYK